MDALDFLTKTVEAISRHGLSIPAIVIVILSALRTEFLRAKLLKRLPRRYRTASQLDRIERELREVKEAVERCVPYSDGKPAQSLTGGVEKNSLSSPGATSPADSIVAFTRIKKAISHLQRRLAKMNSNTNYYTLIPALIGVLKLILQPLGFDLSHVTDSQVNDLCNGIAALLAIIGVFLPHRKVSNGFDETKTS
jgi:uncharacterized membrane protein